MRKDQLTKRLMKVAELAAQHPSREVRRIIYNATNEELREIVYGNITPERLQEIAEGIAERMKANECPDSKKDC